MTSRQLLVSIEHTSPRPAPAGRRLAIVLYEGFMALDAIGPYEVLSRVPGLEVVFVSSRPGRQRTGAGATLLAETPLDDVPAPDLVLVPGGSGQEAAMRDEGLLEWLREVHEHTEYTTSVCTGSLVLAAAGLLDGRRATSHWLALERLGRMGAVPVAERIVQDGKLITCAGVSAGIDMGLDLAARLAGEPVGRAIQLGIEYDPQPPWDAGSPAKAQPETVALLREASRHLAQPAQPLP
jgi:transcriptional regulator GlxA family with amidase domain